MDNKVIEVLDYMGEKLGIAIDWTADNVMPQATEFLGRYQVYAIINCVLWIIIWAITITLGVIVFKKAYKGVMSHDRDNIWYDLHWCSDGILTVIIAIFGIGAIAFMIGELITNVFDVVKWAVIPEMKFFETFSEYLKSAS